MWWSKRNTTRNTRGHDRSQTSSPLIQALEPRLMFDGAAVATALQTSDAPAQGSSAHSSPSSDGSDHALPPTAATPPQGESGTRSVLFVDARVKGADELVADVRPGTEVVYLRADQDGLAQMNTYLAGHPGAQSVQILAHGYSGDLWLGSSYLSAENLNAYSDSLARLGQNMAQGGDILIYACNTADGERGSAFVDALAAGTGRDIAASSNRTGAGSDWVLEVTRGSIESASVLSATAEYGYKYNLATITVTSNADTGAGTLRNAIAGAITGDTITFSSGMTVGLTTGQLVINKNLTIDGDLNNDGVADVTLDANYRSRVLQVQAGSNVMLDGLVITRGLVSGDGGDAGSGLAAANAFGGGIWNAGTLTLLNTSVTANAAAGGGGGGGNFAYDGGGGGGGGALGGGIGGRGGESGVSDNLGASGSANQGGRGGADSAFPGMGGQGGTGVGGAGGSYLGYSTGGTGGTATNGSISIGGGGGGLGTDATGGRGGSAAGGIYNAGGGTINVIGNSIISNNLGAGGGGGGGGAGGSLGNQNGGDGGRGVGAVWNKGTFNITAANNAAMTGNGAGTGAGGQELGTGSPGSSPAAVTGIYNDGGLLNTSYVPNAPPVLGGLQGDSVTFTEGDSAQLIDLGSNATVSDGDSADFNGGSVRVSITTNRVTAEDLLSIRNQGTGAGQIGVSGSTITYGGVAIGTFTGGSGSNDLVITFNSTSATPAAVEALLHNLVYDNSNVDNPTASARTLSVTVYDGDSYTTTNNTVTVNVVAVNDAPTLSPANSNASYTEGGSAAVLSGSLTLADVDSTTFQGATVTVSDFRAGDVLSVGSPNGFTVSYDSGTGVLTLSGGGSLASLQAALRSITYSSTSDDPTAGGTDATRQINFTVTDSGGATSTAVTAQVAVTGVNDAPVVTVSGPSASWSEGNNVASTPVAVDPGLTLSDADGPNPNQATARMLTYYSSQDTLSFVNDGLTMGNIIGTWTVGNGTLTLTSAGNQATVAEFQAALRAITYNNSSESPNSTTRTVQFIVTDGSNAQSTAVTRDITITAVNDSPTISAVASLPITEDTPTALGQITFSDVDTTLGVATFSVGSGTLSAIGAGGVTVGGTATALTLSGTLANINLFIANNRLVYTPAANASGDVTLTININTTSVSDATTTVTLQVAAVNDAPVITAPASITVTEDVSSVISGFSFTDVDAGINTVTATFSVPSGTLSAVTGMGVTVTGSDTGELTLSGSLADINFFVAANGVTFKTAQDATTSVTLTVTLNDKGFSGSGGEQTDTKTVTLNVSAVNDAPVNNVPAAQTAQQNIALGFNTANGNAISITDVDAGNGLMTVTLTATNGTLSLGSLSGITVLLGTGTNDASMIFEGNRANINAALQTLSFKSGSTFLGAASLTIETNDNGNSGSGGAKTDVDTISINVIPVNPKVTSVSAQGLDRTVKIGDEVLVNMVWDQVVNVDTSGGIPSLLLETGLIDRNAIYVSGSGSNTLVFKYTVQAGDVSADLDFQSTAALQLNGAVVTNASNDMAVLTLPTVGGADSLGGRSNIVVDGVVPMVGSVSVPADGTYIAGQNLDFTVNFSEAVVVDTSGGTPRIAITLDTGGTV
ncbi:MULTISPECIES: DUF4347 domain-containing protein, partial [unclassified Pseudomonas]|uniref:DUF4347 domain-containing protein n=1 Tax=unclassified Pseudomonas TaxID=196821 RepID=UPI00244C51E9